MYGVPAAASSAAIASVDGPPSLTTSTRRSIRGVVSAWAVPAGRPSAAMSAPTVSTVVRMVRFMR